MKKYSKIIFVFIFLAGASFLVWTYAQNKGYRFQVSREENITLTENNKEPQNIGSIGYLTELPVLGLTFSEAGDALWYFSNDLLYRRAISDSNDVKEYPLPAHDSVTYVLWPPTGSDFIIGSGDARHLFDSGSNKFIPYPDEVKFIQWLPIGQKIAYIWAGESEITLSVATPDLASPRKIAKLPHADFRLAVSPNGKSFLLFSGRGNDPIYLVIDGIAALEDIAAAQAVDSVKFSSDGRNFAYVTNVDGRQHLFLYDILEHRAAVDQPYYLSGDYAWSVDGKRLYYSVQDSGLQQLNVDDKISTRLTDKNAKILASEILLDNSENALYFVEKATGRLGKLKLK